MADTTDSLPDNIEALKALVIATRTEAEKKAAEAARAVADLASVQALIAHQKLVIEKLKRELYGSRSERSRKLIDQMELELEEMEAQARQDELAAERLSKSAGTASIPGH